MKSAIAALLLLAGLTSTASAQWTSASPTAYLTNTGWNVGIGTTTPASNVKLDIVSTVLFGTYTQTSASGGIGLFGLSSHSTSGYGVWGRGAGSGSVGVYGEATSTASGAHWGVYATAAGAEGVGVLGKNDNGTGTTYGIIGQVASTGGRAVLASATASSGTNVAVQAATNSSSGYALYATGGRNYFQGNLGVGTDQPATKLHVNGTARMENLAATNTTTRGALGIDSANGNISARSFGAGNDVIAYSVPGSYSLTIPAGVTTVKVTLWGAGAGANPATGTAGGSGAYVEAYMRVTPGNGLSITVGVAGDTSGNWSNGNGEASSVSSFGSGTVTAGGGYSTNPCISLPGCSLSPYQGGTGSLSASASGDVQSGYSSTVGYTDFLPSRANGRVVEQFPSSGTSVKFVAPGTGGGILSGVAWNGAQGYVIVEY